MGMRWRAAILTASDRGARGERESTSALVIRELVEEELRGEIVDDRVVPDELYEIMAALIEMTDYHRADLILTTGGSGLGPRDVTPEALKQVVDREVPGFGERIRSALAAKNMPSSTFVGTAGLRGSTLIVNLPGSPEGVGTGMLAIMNDLAAALAAISGEEEGA